MGGSQKRSHTGGPNARFHCTCLRCQGAFGLGLMDGEGLQRPHARGDTDKSPLSERVLFVYFYPPLYTYLISYYSLIIRYRRTTPWE